MKKEYKEFAINKMYGIIQTTGAGLKTSVGKQMFERFGILPDMVEVIQTDNYVDNEAGRTIWVGSLELILTINGEKYSVLRDWLDEYIVDRRHPDYETDFDFYESNKHYGHKRCKQLLEALENE